MKADSQCFEKQKICFIIQHFFLFTISLFCVSVSVEKCSRFSAFRVIFPFFLLFQLVQLLLLLLLLLLSSSFSSICFFIFRATAGFMFRMSHSEFSANLFVARIPRSSYMNIYTYFDYAHIDSTNIWKNTQTMKLKQPKYTYLCVYDHGGLLQVSM